MGRGGNTKEKAQWAQICEVTGKWRVKRLASFNWKEKNFPKKVPATETLKRERRRTGQGAIFYYMDKRVQTPGRASP